MITSVCRGWHDGDGKKIHYDVRVLIQGHPERGESDGFCSECKAIVFSRLAEAKRLCDQADDRRLKREASS